MGKILINGNSYYFDEEKEFIKDGHAYCKKCGERKDGNPITTLGTTRIFKRSCRCDREIEELRKNREIKENIKMLKEVCFLSNLQQRYTFENYKGEKGRNYKIAENYIKNFEEMRKDNIGLLFYGNVGSGKTYLACMIANKVIENYMINVKVRNFSQIINDIQNGGFEMDKNQYIDRLVSTPLLILDDLGMERNTSYAKEQIYNIVDSRYLKNKPTIFTTNLSYEEMLDEEDIDYRRIYSRILGMTVPVLVEGSDYREAIQLEKLNRSKNILLESI